MLEESKIDAFLVRLNAPCNCVLRLDFNPPDEIRLLATLERYTRLYQNCYLAVNLQLLHLCHSESLTLYFKTMAW